MFDKNDYLSIIEHAKGSEKSELKAFKIDDEDGIAENIGFKSNMISKVDYFLEKNKHIQLIELTDLKECLGKIKNKIEEINKENIKGTLKTKRKKEAWKSLTDEFCKKWNGSIAVIERLYRKTHQFEDDPKYSLLIVCKNGTDIRMRDDFAAKLSGMMNEVEAAKVCTTEDLESLVILKV